MNKETLKRIIKNFYVYGCMGSCGSLTKAQRKAYLESAQKDGLLDQDCLITEAGKDFARAL